MRKNVLQIVGSFHQGGSERQAVQLARLLHADKTFNVHLAALNNEGVLRAEVESIGLPNTPEFRLSSFYDLNFFRQLRNCAGFIRENRIELVHTHDFYTNVFGMAAARLANVRVKIASKRETSGMRSRSQKIIEKIAFKQADVLTVNAVAVKNYLIESGVSAEKIQIVYNGLDLERLTPKETNRRKICEELNLPTLERIRFVTLVANLRHAVKNQPMFLRAARTVAEKSAESHFILAGEGELRSDLETLAKKSGIENRTHFVGRCTKIPELLSISHAGVLTSFAEGFSNSILEYMAAKLPVVATNVGGASEAIAENETGFLVDSDDDAALAKRLLELLGDPERAKKMGARGREAVEREFSCAAQLEKTLGIYERKLNER